MLKPSLMFVLALGLVACGGSSSQTAPTKVGPPSVAGNYSGTMTVAYPSLGQSGSCNASTSVSQSGYSISVAPLQLSGASTCNGLSIPVGNATIDVNGSLGSSSGVTQSGSCFYNYQSSGGFFGSQFRASIGYTSTSSACTPFTVSFTLNRS